jgi:hypothetical protein
VKGQLRSSFPIWIHFRGTYSTVKSAVRQLVLFPAESEARASSRYVPVVSFSTPICSAMSITAPPDCIHATALRNPVSTLSSRS